MDDRYDRTQGSLGEELERKFEHLAYQARNIEDCAMEPLANCGAIQPFGLLMVVDAESHKVIAASENWTSVLGLSSLERVLESPVEDWLDVKPDLAQMKPEDPSSLCRLGKISVENMNQWIVSDCWKQGSHYLLEFEHKADRPTSHSMEFISDLLLMIQSEESIEAKGLKLARTIHSYSGYDRIMIYRFDEEWNGEVIAESKKEGLSAFLHLKYPASDIPPQMRQLFFQNLSRVIYDSRAPAVPILSRRMKASDIDLSNSLARAASPFHLQYLENMGVRATLSIPIRSHGRLWGLIACHHYSNPVQPDRTLRLALQVASQIFSGAIDEVAEREKMGTRAESLGLIQSLINDVAKGADIVSAFEKEGQRLLALTSSTSAYLSISGRELSIGPPISSAMREAVLKKARSQGIGPIWQSSRLKEDLGLSAVDVNAAGALAVALSVDFQDAIVWFRPEEPQEVHWGGERSKAAHHNPPTRAERLTPRRSFAEWTERVRFLSRPWSQTDIESTRYFLLAFVKEIFERAQTLSHAYTELEHVNRAKDEFISTLSHELRTPLGIIIGWLDILREDPIDNPEVAQGFEIIDRNAKHQVAMINDLLDISRIISGRMRIEVRSDIKVSSIISALIESMQPAANAKGIKLRWAPDPKVELTVDPDRFRQIVWNLLSNALKFTPNGGEIRVQVKRDASTVSVSVEDTGIGIEHDQLNRIFDRFAQIHSTSTTAGGLGIGLSIVKGLVELHGGHVRAESAGLGHGARFIATFPIAPAVATSPSRDREARVVTKAKQLGGVQVLIAEDQWEALTAMKRICEKNGATVKTAASGQEALDILRHEDFDLILSDIGMPKMDGYEFIRAWRSEENRQGKTHVPAIAFTAYATPNDRRKALDAGFNDHIPKPVNKDNLFAMISSLGVRRHG